MSKLILACPGETIFSAEDRLTGQTDVLLTEHGRRQAHQAGEYIAGQVDVINVAHYAMLRRAQTTLMTILGEVACCPDIDIQAHAALKDRDYGSMYTGQIEQDIREQYSEEQFMKIRRGWDYPLPDGESLKDVYERVIPVHEGIVIPDLKNDKTVLVVADPDPLRAYAKHLEDVPESQVPSIELGTAEVRIYDFDEALNIANIASHVVGDVH